MLIGFFLNACICSYLFYKLKLNNFLLHKTWSTYHNILFLDNTCSHNCHIGFHSWHICRSTYHNSCTFFVFWIDDNVILLLKIIVWFLKSLLPFYTWFYNFLFCAGRKNFSNECKNINTNNWYRVQKRKFLYICIL